MGNIAVSQNYKWAVPLTRLVAEKVSRTMNALKKMTLSWEQGVLRLLEGFHISPVNTEILETPEDYLGRCNVYLIREVYILFVVK